MSAIHCLMTLIAVAAGAMGRDDAKIRVYISESNSCDYTILVQHDGGKNVIRHDNKFVVYDKNGDVIKIGSTRMLGNAVKDACRAITARND